MKRSCLETEGKTRWPLLIILSLFLGLAALPSNSVSSVQAQQNQIEKAKIFQDAYPLISESDLYCSFLILDEAMPDIKIISADKEEEKIFLSDSDIFYIDRGSSDGLEVGKIFLILEIGPQIKSPITNRNYGLLALKRGKASIVRLEENRGTARVEKACGQIEIGNFLVPFEEKEGILGKDLGFEASPEQGEAPSGDIIYLEKEYNIIGSGHWALIDLGKENGVQVGQQMTVFRRLKGDLPPRAIGNLIVIDTQLQTSTVKILSCSDVLEVGDEVQIKKLESDF